MTNKNIVSVAIDGPSGAGKSSLAKEMAAKLGYVYVDTGAIYRSIGLFVKKQGVSPGDAAAVAALLPEICLDIVYSENGLQHMILNGLDVTEEIRIPEMSRYASEVSAHGEVRAFLLETQRDMAKTNSVIMDGRDIGTVVLPEATVKIFLTAAPEERARRRCRELEHRGTPQAYESVLEDINRRDYNDSHRTVAPLRQAEDAVLLDTTALSFEESLEALLAIVKGREGK